MAKLGLAQNVTLLTIGAVYFLILVGGIVRSTGSGMGCPDWPKCFGSYYPPSDVSSLPSDYQQVYVTKRIQKNQRLGKVLHSIGLHQLANQVVYDKGAGETTYFDPMKAWIEYLNRLVGVIIGFFVIWNCWQALKQWKKHKKIVWLGISGLILVLFQGWIGSLVVSTNLLPGFITFHMFLALLLVAILITQQFYQSKERTDLSVNRHAITLLLILFVIQILLGTQVREGIDEAAKSGLDRPLWITQLGYNFYIHRSFSLFITVLVVGIIYREWKTQGEVNPWITVLGILILLEIIFGIVLSYLNVPAFAQPVHLFLGTLAFGVIFFLFLSQNIKPDPT